jgi:hypothetical protein
MKVTYKDFLNEKFDAVKEVRAEKRKLIEQLQKVQDKIKTLDI